MTTRSRCPSESLLGKHLLEVSLALAHAPARSRCPCSTTPDRARPVPARRERGATATWPDPEHCTGAEGAYAAAGVDIDAGDKAVELMKGWVEKARRPEVIGGLGGFAGLFDASALTRYERPLLATSTDGVGTKVAIAQAMDVHDTIGHRPGRRWSSTTSSSAAPSRCS